MQCCRRQRRPRGEGCGKTIRYGPTTAHRSASRTQMRLWSCVSAFGWWLASAVCGLWPRGCSRRHRLSLGRTIFLPRVWSLKRPQLKPLVTVSFEETSGSGAWRPGHTTTAVAHVAQLRAVTCVVCSRLCQFLVCTLGRPLFGSNQTGCVLLCRVWWVCGVRSSPLARRSAGQGA